MQRSSFPRHVPPIDASNRQSFPIEGTESVLLEEFKQQLLSDARGPRLASVDTLSLSTDMDPCFSSLNTGFPKALRALTS